GPAGTIPEADSGRCVQQVLLVEPEQQHQPQQPEADSAMSGKPIGLTRERPGPSAGRVDYPDVFCQRRMKSDPLISPPTAQY
ncbi:hypothetical protein MMT24_29605, partial [Escherichia coli]|nr:hypothetical protein [Escherichia coli]